MSRGTSRPKRYVTVLCLTRVEVSLTNVLQLVQHKTVDVSVAVSLDTGLITPIIKNAAGKGVSEISANMKVSTDQVTCMSQSNAVELGPR